jgi:HAD superfamily hydrolase (TIGR01509 family)
MPEQLRAVVFDLDGVLVASEGLHHRAMERLLAPRTLEQHDHDAIVGTTLGRTLEYVSERFQLEGPIEALMAAYSELVVEELKAAPLEPLGGALELVAALRERRLPIAVASQSQPAWIEATLRGAGLDGAFNTVLSAVEVERGKPAPDIYLEAARRLGVAPPTCLAIEDSAPGVASAHAAGMFVVQVRESEWAAPPQPLAHVVIDSLREFDLRWLDGGTSGL